MYKAAGYADYVNKTHNYEETHALAPRATLFRRDQHEANGAEGVMKILRSNNYKVDPLSKGSPRKAICSRGDLDDVSELDMDKEEAKASKSTFASFKNFKDDITYLATRWPMSLFASSKIENGLSSKTKRNNKNKNEFKQSAYEAQVYGYKAVEGEELTKSVKKPGGCYDTKISSTEMTRKGMTARVVSGPTRANGLPAFAWKDFPNHPHKGLPDKYEFAPVMQKPKLNPMVFGSEYFRRDDRGTVAKGHGADVEVGSAVNEEESQAPPGVSIAAIYA